MSQQTENAALAQLLGTITDRGIRRKVHKLLNFGEEAVRSLGELDAALYLREDGEEQLQIVSDAVLSHVRRLLEYLAMVATPAESSAEAAPQEIEFDFTGGDSKDRRGSDNTQRSKKGYAVGRTVEKTDDGKWGALAAEMDTLQYGLGSELKEFDRRFREALTHDRKEQAVRDLNDATTSLMDGVFAVMTTVYACFLGYAEPERMIPGHRDTLGKALAVRRSLAVLRRQVQELNRPIQDRDSDPALRDTNYRLVVEALERFGEDDVFQYLRSDDRKEFVRFHEILSQGNAKANRNDCEGFDKYLDSLAFVNQRGVLIKHDTDLKAKIGDELKRAVMYAALLPDVVCEAIHQAFIKGERLFGLNPQLDGLVEQWSALTEDERNDLDRAVAMAEQLKELVQPEPVSSGGGDFF